MTILLWILNDIMVPGLIIYGGLVIGLYLFTLISLVLTLIPFGWFAFEVWLFYWGINNIATPIFNTRQISFMEALAFIAIGKFLEWFFFSAPKPKEEDNIY